MSGRQVIFTDLDPVECSIGKNSKLRELLGEEFDHMQFGEIVDFMQNEVLLINVKFYNGNLYTLLHEKKKNGSFGLRNKIYWSDVNYSTNLINMNDEKVNKYHEIEFDYSELICFGKFVNSIPLIERERKIHQYIKIDENNNLKESPIDETNLKLIDNLAINESIAIRFQIKTKSVNGYSIFCVIKRKDLISFDVSYYVYDLTFN